MHPRRSRRGVGMWKSVVSISKVCGKGVKNSFIVFPRLSMDRHFHACFGCQRTQAAAFARAFSHSVSNATGLAWPSVECMRVWLYQSSQAMVSSLA